MKKRGRPSSYTPEIAQEILERLAAGESLRGICRDLHMPSDASVRRWAVDDVDGFSSRYAQARDIGLDTLADEILEISNTPKVGVRREQSKEGTKVVEEDMLGHRKLQVDARKWYLSKLAPKKYGDKQQVALSGHLAVGDMSEDEIRAELAALSATGVLKPEEPEYDENDISDLL